MTRETRSVGGCHSTGQSKSALLVRWALAATNMLSRARQGRMARGFTVNRDKSEARRCAGFVASGVRECCTGGYTVQNHVLVATQWLHREKATPSKKPSATYSIAAGLVFMRVLTGSSTRARTWDLRINRGKETLFINYFGSPSLVTFHQNSP